ncbi:UDP-glucosyl transferase family protein [Coniochaeta ligniaria NRRL 30616]|uniref:UDP-glucosyl transferase family protein n=1 Tax=Coniochaeta ligniaria NRRL 30616 TaxID=1408157 RepID=A0A1J7ISL3_9PEZI|nr:UDP-glucosyl transferase family protein [Coniochaeta ligniaria NRRL 30616]
MPGQDAKVSIELATVLLVAGTGGFTHAAPVLELGRILAQRGHRIEFATHKGQERWVAPEYYRFVSQVHTMGDPMTAEQEAAHYLDMQQSDPRRDYWGYFRPKHTIDAFWTSDFAFLQDIVAASRPDVIVADFFVIAARDIQRMTGTPVAMVWPQMPYGFAKVPYIPGVPGFQIDALSSEHASLATRVRAELRPLRALPAIIHYLRFVRRMRRAAGVNYSLPNVQRTPDHLALVNSFWGLETPKDLPPLIAAVGPILVDEYTALDDQLKDFLRGERRVVYLSFGTHIQLQPDHLARFLDAFTVLIREKLIDGVIWVANAAQRKLFPLEQTVHGSFGETTVGHILENNDPAWYFTPFAPQRAILDHPGTVLFVTHAGGGSVNEGLFHGTPMLCLGFFFDQPLNALRIQEAGAGMAMDKESFSASEIVDKCRKLLMDEDGLVQQNVQRMAHIARVSSRKKYYAADLIEEVMYDRMFSSSPPPTVETCGNGGLQRQTGKLRPPHLQTADARMSAWRAQNWDLTCLGCAAFAGALGLGYHAYIWLRRR